MPPSWTPPDIKIMAGESCVKGSFEALHYYTQSRPSVTGARTGDNVLHYQITHRDITIIALLMRLDHMDTHKSVLGS